MEVGGAYGGGKAGGTFDPMTFIQRPQVILRGLCWLFSVVVFGCITSQGWLIENGKEKCIYNGDAMACKYGTFIGIFGFLGSMGFLAGEYLFEQMSSVKTRKHYVLGDLGFSGFWTFMYFVTFIYLWNQWSSSPTPAGDYGVSNANAAIFFSFLSMFTWAGCAFFAYKRFQIGADAAFASTYESDPAANQYTSYPIGNETDQYSQAPFTGQQEGSTEYQAPTY